MLENPMIEWQDQLNERNYSNPAIKYALSDYEEFYNSIYSDDLDEWCTPEDLCPRCKSMEKTHDR